MGILIRSLVFLFLFTSLSAFDPKFMDLVDAQGNCYLIRGDLPEMHGNFCYHTLIKNISKKLSHYQINEKTEMQLIVVSLLSSKKEQDKINIEKRWFFRNPSKGGFIHFPLKGIEIDLSTMAKYRRDRFVTSKDFDNIIDLMSKLDSLITLNQSQTTAIYIHCNVGKDRTGEACACYMMKFKGRSYESVMAESKHIAHRSISDKCVNVIKWYAFYLRDVEKVSSIGLVEGK